jgi:hypothetical protein
LGAKTFEELCRAHIQAFSKGAEDFALNTQLSDRVSRWQAKLAPILEEEERRSQFDIHKYSSLVIETVQQEIQRGKRKSDGSVQVRNTAGTVGQVMCCCRSSPFYCSFNLLVIEFPSQFHVSCSKLYQIRCMPLVPCLAQSSKLGKCVD